MLSGETEYIDHGRIFHGSIPLVMGTRLEAVVVGSSKESVERLWAWACVEAGVLDAVLNRFDPESEISELNRSADGPALRPSGLLCRLVALAKDYHSRTLGLFDIAKGGMEDVVLESSGLLRLGGHQLDFGGFAKGCFLREFRERLSVSGVESAFLDFGGSSIATIGSHPFGDCWKVGVRNPFGGSLLTEIDLVGMSMSTSGNSPGYSSHIVNPFTGESVDGRKVVTVVCGDPLDAEVLSTALMVAGPEEAELLKAAFPGTEAFFFD